MGYYDEDLLKNFDVYPLVYAAGKETTVHIRDLGGRRVFEPNTAYAAVIVPVDDGNPVHFPATGHFHNLTLESDADGNFAFPYTFESEQLHFIRFLDGDGRKKIQFPVYCVADDLVGRYPYVGDLHMHTTYSDGRQNPAVVCANYRRHGYDFTVISDHRRYYPSLLAVEAYKDVPTGLTVVQGEEVHMPDVQGKRCDVHIVNFGGEFSVNALVDSAEANEEVGTDLSVRAMRTEDVPDVMTHEAYEQKMLSLAAQTKTPDNVDALPYAMCCWIFDMIRKGNGLGIFTHPNWINNAFHVPEAFTDYMMQTRPFDAFEVLGGEEYYEQNGFQTHRYYTELARGNRFPIVGSTDSHSSYPSNENAYVASTMVFSPENERTALIQSIKDYYSVAIDGISKEFRLVGEMRLSKYACFLLQTFFPLHDELCYEEGRLMKQYATGTDEEKQDARTLLNAIHGRMEKQRKKYFAF